MTKRPNAVGRIEGVPKVKRDWGRIGKITIVSIAIGVLPFLGIKGTLEYQKFIGNVKTQGITEFKAHECDEYADPKTGQKWLECDL